MTLVTKKYLAGPLNYCVFSLVQAKVGITLVTLSEPRLRLELALRGITTFEDMVDHVLTNT